MGCSSSVPIANRTPGAASDTSHRGGRSIHGVSLEYLEDFVKKNGNQQLAGLSCYDVCNLVIKPMTLSTGYGSTTGRSVVHMLDTAFDTRPSDVQPAHWHVLSSVCFHWHTPTQ